MNDIDTVVAEDIAVKYISNCSDDNMSEPLCHEKYEVLYITSGCGRYISEGSEMPVNPGSIFLARPLEYRKIEIDEGSSFSGYSVRFLSSSLSEISRNMLDQMTDTKGGIYCAAGASGLTVDSVFDRFYLAVGLPDRERRAFLEAVLSELIIFLSLASSEHSRRTDDNLATRVSRYINSNLSRDLTLDTLARRFFVNKYYLCRTFKTQSGISIHNYISRKRVLYAKQLIDSGETASRAAYSVGFGDYSAFYRAYMKIYGVSPTSSEEERGS